MQLNNSAERYVKRVSVNPEMSHNKILSKIADGSSVLEFGPASGAMTEVLCKEKKCKVSIVELDKACFENALQFAQNGICCDIEEYQWMDKFSGQKFDYIIFADVLEHLRAPGVVLNRVKDFLKDAGSVLISVPNIAHNSVIIQLINNHFIYQNTGILDHTHVKHFTFSELETMCVNSGYGVVYMDGVYIAVGKNEFDISYADVKPEIAQMLKNRPLGELYQHITEIKKKEYLDEFPQKIDNRLGRCKDFTEVSYEQVTGGSLDNELVNDTIAKALCDNPNFFFENNNEIARLRLQINELYLAQPDLENVIGLRTRIQEYQEEVRSKNIHIQSLLAEEEKKNMRILELQQEEEERNNHIQRQNAEILQLNGLLEKKTQEMNEIMENEKQKWEIEKEELVAIGQEKQVLQDLVNTITNEKQALESKLAELEQELRNKQGHIELLLESDRELERLRAQQEKRFINRIFPKNSKRRLFVKLAVKCVCHPIKTIKMIFTKGKLKNFFRFLKKDGVFFVNQLVEDNYRGTTVKKQELVVTKVKEERDITAYQPLTFTKHKKPQVSIIIPVYNQFEYTYNCLKSILNNSGDITYEIIIANDCSTDLTTRITEVVKNIKVVTNKENLRFLKNCNNAAKYANGQYILFLNNDTQVQPEWLTPLVELMERDEKIGMVGSKLVYADGRLQEAGGILWKDGSAWNYGNRKDPADPEFNYVKEADYISGAAIMIKAALWKEIGGFDETFAPAYYEDTDLAFEVRKHGYKVMYQPLSVVVHFEGVSNGTDLSSGQKSYQQVNAQKFYEKWKNVLETEHYPNAQEVFKAKDRSRDKKHVLVVDHYVPMYDKDAGNKCSYMYISLFVKLGYKVTFIGDNYFKHEPYATELNQMGVEILYGNYYHLNWKQWLKENAYNFDYVYLQRPHISEKYIDLLKEYSKAKIIYFGHDLHYLREYRQYELEKDPALLKSSSEWKKKEFALFNKADVIYVVGSYEQQILQKEFPNKPVRNIPVYIYDGLKKEVNTQFHTRQDIIFVGGFGHPPNMDAVLWFAKEIFPKILMKHPKMKWYIVGSNPTEDILALNSENIIVKGFVSDEELTRLYSECRMAVVPLRVGAGVKGKVVEAVYNRIPLVTTPIGAEGLSTEEKAFVVTECNDNMVEVICNLYEDYNGLEDLSNNCKAFIENHFVASVAEKIVLEDFS